MKISKLHWQSDDDVKETKKEDKLIHHLSCFARVYGKRGIWNMESRISKHMKYYIVHWKAKQAFLLNYTFKITPWLIFKSNLSWW